MEENTVREFILSSTVAYATEAMRHSIEGRPALAEKQRRSMVRCFRMLQGVRGSARSTGK